MTPTNEPSTEPANRDDVLDALGRYGEAMFRKGRDPKESSPVLNMGEVWDAIDRLENNTMRKQAAEITTLTDALTEARAEIGKWENAAGVYESKWEEARAENKRLREALTRLTVAQNQAQ